MTLFVLILLALAVSADAFAASLAKGVRPGASRLGYALWVGLTFGVLEALMPLVGWAFGQTLRPLLGANGHWVAFALLLAAGVHLALTALKDLARPPAPVVSPPPPNVKTGALVLGAVGASLDGAAVGLSLAFTTADIVTACLLFGAVTFVVSVIGVLMGGQAKAKLGDAVELVGGLLLLGAAGLVLVGALGA